MPFTLNGIGTNYVGKRNRLARAGACGQCGRWTTLESFDTREWFVVAFVPLIPLTRYHVLDKCAACSRHQRLHAALWQEQQTQARLSAESLLRQRPGDSRAAIDAHRALSAWQLGEDAAALEAAMGEQYPGVAEVLVYLGQVAEVQGRIDEALRHFERAHSADPADPVAREGLALRAVQAGQPDRALELLEPVLAAKTLQGAAAGCALARALVAGSRFEEGRRVSLALLERFPSLANQKPFARDLARAEKALGAPRTKLAATQRARRRRFSIAALCALVVAGVLWADFAAARSLELYVVESVPGKVVVEIPGAPTLEFRRPGVQKLELPAGTYRARVSGPAPREVSFTIASHAWPRFLDKTVRVLDATGNSLLVVEQATYGRSNGAQRGERHLLFGDDFSELHGIDLAFEEFPRSLYLSGNDAHAERRRVDLVHAPVENVVEGLVADKDSRTAFSLAAWGLGREPGSPMLLESYLGAARAAHAEQQAARFLAPRLEARPVDLSLHRAWIEFASGAAAQEEVRARYRELQRKEPSEKAWPYLLACLSPRVSERTALLDPLLAPDAPPEMWRTMAETQAADAQWSVALDCAETALTGESYDGAAAAVRLEALGALGRAAQLDEEYAALLERDPCDAWVALRRFERLPREVRAAEYEPWQQRVRSACGGQMPLAYVQGWCALSQGDVELLVRLDHGARDGSMRWLLASALADSGRFSESQPYLKGKLRCEIEPYDALAIALACRAGGDAQQAAAWEARALPGLVSPVDAEVARLLAGDRRAAADEALDLALLPWRKAVVLALLSLADDAGRPHLLELALQLQCRPIFPRRIIEELASRAAPR